MPSRLAVDTSMLMFMAERRIPFHMLRDVAGCSEIYTSARVVQELKRIASSSRRAAPSAALSLKVLEKERVIIEPSVKPADQWLLEQRFIATADIELARRARRRGIRVISVTKSNRIVLM